MSECKRAALVRIRVAFLLTILAGCCCGWLFDKDKPHACTVQRSPDEKPYYFGTTSLLCMTYTYYFRRPKRSASMPTLKPIHSWLYYDGHYVEFGIYHNFSRPYNYSISVDHPAIGDKCSYQLYEQPKGYSTLGIDCIKGCARNYMSSSDFAVASGIACFATCFCFATKTEWMVMS